MEKEKNNSILKNIREKDLEKLSGVQLEELCTDTIW